MTYPVRTESFSQPLVRLVETSPFQQSTLQKGSFFSAAKVKRALCYTTSGTSGLGATVVLGLSLTSYLPLAAGLGSIPLYLLAFYFGWQGLRIWDYTDPQELNQIQQEALHTPLLDIAARHGWKNIFRYQILSPAYFTIAFKHYAENMDITTLIFMKKRADEGLELAIKDAGIGGLPQYSIPDLRGYRERFYRDTRSLSCVDILKKYMVEDLGNFQLVSATEAVLLRRLKKEYEEACGQCKAEIDFTEREFQNRPFDALCVNAEGTVFGHELVASANRRRARDPNRFQDFAPHLGVETLGESAFEAPTVEERDQRLAATAFHGDQLKDKLRRINVQYDSFRSTSR